MCIRDRPQTASARSGVGRPGDRPGQPVRPAAGPAVAGAGRRPAGQRDRSGRVDLHREVDEGGRSADRRSDFDEVYGSWAEVATRAPDALTAAPRLDTDVRAALLRAQNDPAGLSDDDYLALLTCDCL